MAQQSDLLIRRCNVCYSEGIPIHKIRFFECGHWCCVACLENSNNEGNRNCGTCRRPRGLGFKIFLAAEDLVDDQIPKRADVELSIVESEAPSFTLEPPEARALIEELEDLKQRHNRLTTGYESLSNRLQACTSERRTFHQQYNLYRSKALQLEEELEEKKKIIQGYVKERHEHEKEKDRLKEKIQSQRQDISLKKKKLAALAKSSKRVPLKDPDASLLVESPLRITTKTPSESRKQRVGNALEESKTSRAVNSAPSSSKRRREA
ncbi:hypothetical protein BJ165DRAFT_1616217 [Panaeolus papilionaceus]|nr:hypothetical protein BJ165DRAFT_1616217 [Panaeolus papilionaceus]